MLLALLVPPSAAVRADGQTAPPPGRTIIVGGDQAYPPYEWLDETGQPRGFNIDLMRAIAGAMGAEVEFRLGPWSRAKSELAEGKVDVLAMFRSPGRAAEFDFSQPHAIISHDIFVRSPSLGIRSLEDLNSLTTIVQKDAFAHDYLREHGLGGKLILGESEADALKMLASGQGDCALVTGIGGRRAMRAQGLSDLHTSGPPLLPQEYCFAVRKGDRSLLDRINRSLASVKADGDYARIHDKWFAEPDAEGTDWGRVVRWGLLVLALLALLLGLTFLWSWSLRRKVKQRTAELQEELAQRRRADQALRESEAKFRTLFETAPDAILLCDRTGIQQANPAAASMLDCQDPAWLLGRRIEEFYAGGAGAGADLPAALAAVLSSPASARLDCDLKRVDGRTFAAGVSMGSGLRGELRVAHVLIRDITWRREAQAALAQSEEKVRHLQRLESVGLMAGGIAHDFSNVLTGIAGFAQLIEARPSLEEASRRDLHEIQRLSDRAAELTRQLLAFSRRQKLEPIVFDLNELVAKSARMLERLIGSAIRMRFLPASGPALVLADPGQIEQVLVNLAVNARDAMPEGGRLQIELSRATGAAPAAGDKSVMGGPHVQLAVSDSGCGMDAATRQRIFEPFFTTKPRGKGTGLGLATCFGIIKQHGGDVWVYSEPGEGTTFRIYLPLAAGESAAAPRHVESLPTARPGETILVAEDEQAIRDMMCTILRSLGYTVHVAAGQDRALALFGQLNGHVDLLVTDMVMPDGSGRRLRELLLARKPDLKVVFMSGHCEQAVMSHGLTGPGTAFLQKPFVPATLARKVRDVLDAHVAPHGSSSERGRQEER